MVGFFSSSQWLVLTLFVLGYLCIIFEQSIKVNKTVSAILMAVACWVAQFSGRGTENSVELFSVTLSESAQIVFFLLGALAIVETIQVHGGLSLLGNLLRFSSKKALVWAIGFLAFFLSSVLDNLTTTVVMIMLLRKLVTDHKERLLFGSAVVIAANAGGAWTPIGDVTTTMLWVGGELSSANMMRGLILPSLSCLIVSLLFLQRGVSGAMGDKKSFHDELQPGGRLVLVCGLLALMSVPVLRYFTGMPPFMGMLTAACGMWFLTDLLHRGRNRTELQFQSILPRLDLTSLLFFLGILLSIGVLNLAGILRIFAEQLGQIFPSKEVIAVFVGLISAVVDNVPLVAACMGMYDLSVYPMDNPFWTLMAYTAGTGGSILIIGSAAGVAFMGLERVNFFWYLKNVSLAALTGYAVGIAVYALQLYAA